MLCDARLRKASQEACVDVHTVRPSAEVEGCHSR